ncbi:ABC transporter ATP-binding protein [Vibrio fluvialis]|nr:ABC transporter ATP-binding protein [Vibrio fluvialis]HDM8035740.1 ABC transporter ATP-binding protein [Vibrio fluvialis clinical-1]EKO3421935.1 ABC transporter ATP-binding protein [Vibrio fluvialis]EKO3522409.1 ABC transporter ATP-binding protein [Vibrio fluvialis]EKO3525686.1 ABC transporter ATP-binding protein [Vibrio fluvialis]
MTQSQHFAIELKQIDKRFGAVHANRAIDLQVPAGTIHGIIGENGAGKSTLMSIIYGFYTPDAGEMRVNNTLYSPSNSQDAIGSGIGMVHQHFMLVDTFTVLENIVLGAESGWKLNDSLSAARKKLIQLEKDYGLDVPLDSLVGDLPVGLQQRVEILKALYRNANVLILDEPTGVLTPQEADHLFAILDKLRSQGTTVIIITHKLREVLAITDNISVMRQGQMVAHVKTSDTNREELAELMVGRKVRLKVEKSEPHPQKALLQVEHLNYVDSSGVPRVKDISFSVRAGELVGIAGVSGNGQSEILSLLSGILKPTSGTIQMNGHTISPQSPADPQQVRAMGVGHIPEDRHKQGLINKFEAQEAYILGYHNLPKYNKGLLQDKQAIATLCQESMNKWDVRPNDIHLKTANFSGGNQQKLVIAREMEEEPDVLLIGQPTRGVDIGAIEYIHQQIIACRDAGKAILLVSVELDEILSLADRILVVFDGAIVGELDAKLADEKTLGLMMANIVPEHVTQSQGKLA